MVDENFDLLLVAVAEKKKASFNFVIEDVDNCCEDNKGQSHC